MNNKEQPPLPYHERLRLIKLGLLPKEAVAKPKKEMKKVSDKKAAEMKAAKDENGDTELIRWFRGRMKVMSPTCQECGMKVETGIYQFAIMHIAHLLPKRDNMCPSVKYHPLNFITLCSDHHHYYDNVSWEEREKMGCWNIVQQRLIAVFPDLDPSEYRHFPESVLRYIENNNPFT